MAKTQERASNQIELDDYEANIVQKAVRQFIALQRVDLAGLPEDSNDPDRIGTEEMIARAESLRQRIDRLPALQPDDPCADYWKS